jgi:hypothetical protein
MSKNGKLIKNLIGDSNYWQLSKPLVKRLGHVPSLILTHLIDVAKYNNMPDEFYQQQSRIMNDLYLSEREVRGGIKVLVNHGVISVTKKGIPAKYFFTLDFNNIEEIITAHENPQWSQNATTTDYKMRPQRQTNIIQTNSEPFSVNAEREPYGSALSPVGGIGTSLQDPVRRE